MLLLIGPAVAVIGIVAVVFVMRHKSVEKRSMYSSRRSQIEHKVRAARERTLAPGRHNEKAGKDSFDQAAAAAPAPTLTYEPSAYAAPPVAPPPKKGHAEPAQPVWEPEPASPAPSPAPFAQPAPAHEPPAYEPPAYQPPAAEPPAWSPTAPAPEPERATPVPAAMTPAGAGASWSVVGETKASSEPEPDTKKKKSKGEAQGGAWSLASGEPAGDEVEAGPKSPSAFIAVAQYAVLVVGLVMVLIGVVVMVANSHPS
jgi:uncharacterized integral membrane protein